MSRLENKVVSVLRGLKLETAKISVEESGTSLFATIVSNSFGSMDEADRQTLVWNALRESLTEFEVAAVEFVFTVAPGEAERYAEAAS